MSSFFRELRNIAVNRRFLPSSVVSQMKKSAAFLGVRRVKKQGSTKSEKFPTDQDEDDWEFEYDLLRPDQIVIADDTNAYQLFGAAIFTAPQEDLLEGK